MPTIRVPYTLVFEGDNETYDTTRVSFTPPHAGPYILVYLKPMKPASTYPPGLVDVEQAVSQKAKQAYTEGANFILGRNYEMAVEPLKRAIAIQPDYFRAVNDLGVTYMKLNRLDEAAEALRQAIKLNNKTYLPRFNLGLVLKLQSKYQEAIEVLGALRREHPELTNVHLQLIEVLLGAHAWPRAEEELMQAINLKDVNVVDLKIKLGVARMKQAKSAAAVEILNEAVNAEPENAVALLNLGAALHQAGKPDNAEISLVKAYAVGGATVSGAQLLLGMIYYQKQNYSKAIEAFETYLRDSPGAPNASQVRGSIEQIKQTLMKK